jgi:2-keto-4-pentenoate hydratase/2-oxohepta-3-ene-1,7-dioic acid hydratase in catechol pathway
MKLARFSNIDTGAVGIGLVEGDEIIDLRSADDRLPLDIVELLNAGEEGFGAVRAASRSAVKLPLDSVRPLSPLQRPRKFLGLGTSYRSNIEKILARGGEAPARQVWFNKQVTSVNGPYDPVYFPRVSDQLDYEGELAVVIGRSARHVRSADAADFVAGYMVCNDFSIRDWVSRTPTGTLGKSYDSHGPIGPWLTTADEIQDVGRLRLRTWVDGDLRQDGNTDELIYSIGEMIAELSSIFTLEPGDILTTGSPTGTGISMSPPRFLHVGQTVRVEIEGLGHIENRVVPEPAAS